MDIATALESLVPSAIYAGSTNPQNKFELRDQIVETTTLIEDEETHEVTNHVTTETIQVMADTGQPMTDEEIYAALRWEDERPQPRFEDITTAWDSIHVAISWTPVLIERGNLLAASDWTQLGDAPLTQQQKTAWLAYRKALRDITSTYATPDLVVWPAQPE